MPASERLWVGMPEAHIVARENIMRERRIREQSFQCMERRGGRRRMYA